MWDTELVRLMRGDTLASGGGGAGLASNPPVTTTGPRSSGRMPSTSGRAARATAGMVRPSSSSALAVSGVTVAVAAKSGMEVWDAAADAAEELFSLKSLVKELTGGLAGGTNGSMVFGCLRWYGGYNGMLAAADGEDGPSTNESGGYRNTRGV